MGRRVLVTGAAGFLGSRIVPRLLSDGHTVGVILRDGGNHWRISGLLGQLTVIRADLNDLSPVRRQLEAFAPECAVNLAWQGVGNRQRNDLAQAANIRWSFSLLRLLHDLGCSHYVGFGSQAEYGPYSGAISEDLPACPTTIYGMAKLVHCLEALEFCRTHNMRFAWLRLFSSYGPGDDPNWMIPYVILSLLRGERPSLTMGEQRWDYIYADDAADAAARVVASPHAEGIFNLGSGEARPLREIIEMVRDLVDPSVPLGFGEIPYRPDQVMHLQADIRRLTEAVGWHPRTALESGLRTTVDWYLRAKGESGVSAGASPVGLSR